MASAHMDFTVWWERSTWKEESQSWVLGKERSGQRWDYRAWAWIWFCGRWQPPEVELVQLRPDEVGGGRGMW